MITRLLKLK